MINDDDNFNDDTDESNEDFNPEDFFDDSDDEDCLSDEEFRKEAEAYREMPLFKKAEQIRKLTTLIVDTFDREEDKFQMKEQMLLNAYMLGAKIAGAEAGDFYTLRMENAVVIKIHARELLAQTSLCKAEKLCNAEYLHMLRDELEEFRNLFIEWVKSFDKFNDIQDNWGLFY